jgi:glucose/arabinose dehydrogenase
MNDRRRAAKTLSSCATVAMTGQRLYNAPRVSSVTLPESRQMTNVKSKWDGGYDH